jgi:zinc protease
MAGRLLMRGTRQHDRQQLQDEFDKLKSRINVAGAPAGASGSIVTVRAGLAGSLRLVAEMLKESTFPEAEFEQLRQQSIASLESSRSEPETMVSIARNRHINRYPPEDPRATLTIDESLAELKKTTLDEARKFYTDFYGASNAEVAVVGDFDPAEIRALTEQLFGSWKSPKPYAVIRRDFSGVFVINQTFQAPDKANAFVTAITTFPMDQQDPDYPYMFLANLIVGGDPKSRMWKRIRETEGLSYSVNTGFNAGAQERFAQFSMAAIANPQNVPFVEAAFGDELAKVLRNGFTAEEVAVAKSAYLQDAQVNRAQDTSLVTLLARQAELGRTMQREIDIERRIAEATPEHLGLVFRKWINPQALSYFRAGDFRRPATVPAPARK